MNDCILRRRFLLCAAGTVFLSLLLSRTASILYTYAATDILYSESLLPTLLNYLRQILSACAFGAGIAAITAAAHTGDAKSARILAGIHAALLLTDVLCAFAVDALSGAVEAALLGIAALFNLGDWLFSALLILLAYLSIRRGIRRNHTSSAALLAASLIILCGRMALQLFYIVQFLIEVEFAPYASEIIQMVGEILQVLVMSGGAVWLSAVGFLALLRKIGIPQK